MSQPGRTLHMDSTPLLRPGVAPHPCRVADGRARLSSGFQPTPPHVPPGQGSSLQEPAEPPRAANPAPGRALLQRRQSGAAQAQPHAQGTACFTSAPLHLRCVVSRTSSGTPGLKAKAETPGGLCPTSTIAIRSLLAKQTAAGQPLAPAKPHCSPAIGQGCPRATQQHMQPTGTAPMFALWFSHTTTPSKQTTR